ncbi:MAG: terminase small subunit [Gammaproteobacteria bacterium]|nr:terminase small subunit [Gammaproteobacteria bacterium]
MTKHFAQAVLNGKQRDFVKLYLGRNQRYHGNATQCYIKAYSCTNERVAQASGSRLTKHPTIAVMIQKARQHAQEQIGVDAAFVLEQSVHLYDVAMGNVSVEVDVIDKQGAVSTVEQRDINLTVAAKGLELIGRHTSVQAFQDNVEHTHTHQLERALAKAHQSIEANAQPRDITAECVVLNDDTPHPPVEEGEKRVHQAGGHDPAGGAQGETAAQSAGAAGK